jgi:hypothetical protein
MASNPFIYTSRLTAMLPFCTYSVRSCSVIEASNRVGSTSFRRPRCPPDVISLSYDGPKRTRVRVIVNGEVVPGALGGKSSATATAGTAW